jgi:hypothetical protein
MKLVDREVVTGAHAQFVLGHQVSRKRVSRNWSVQYTWRGRQQIQIPRDPQQAAGYAACLEARPPAR